MNANKQDAGGLPNELGFEQWYVTNTFDYPSNPIGSRDCSIARKAWHAALEAVRNGEQCRAASGWQPAESAPLREAVIVYHCAHWDRLACLHEDGVWWPWPRQAGDEHLAYSPTHWHPIPEAPNE